MTRTNDAESGVESSVADAAGDAGECVVAGGSCDEYGSAVICWVIYMGRGGGGGGPGGTNMLLVTIRLASSKVRSSRRITLMYGKSSPGARCNTHPPTAYTSTVRGCEA